MHRIIHLLTAHRAVCVNGEPRIGKSTLAVAACHYMRRRGRFKYIYYVDLHGLSAARKDLVTAICDAVKTPPKSEASLAEHIQKADCLFLLDNCSSTTPERDINALVGLVKNTYTPKFLITSRGILDFEEGYDMGHVIVGPLEPQACQKLIFHILPSLANPDPDNLNRRKCLHIINNSQRHPYKVKALCTKLRRSNLRRQKQLISSSSNRIVSHTRRRRKTIHARPSNIKLVRKRSSSFGSFGVMPHA